MYCKVLALLPFADLSCKLLCLGGRFASVSRHEIGLCSGAVTEAIGHVAYLFDQLYCGADTAFVQLDWSVVT